MSFRSILSAVISAQMMMPAFSQAALVTGDEAHKYNGIGAKSIFSQSQKRDDGYVLMQDVTVRQFAFESEDEHDHSQQNSNDDLSDLDVVDSGDALEHSDFGMQGEEANSTVVLPMNTRFVVTDGIIDDSTGERYIKVELESGFKFWTELKSFESALYVAEGQVAGRPAGTITSRAGWRRHPVLGGMKCHEGTDIAYPVGTRIGARVGDGKVVSAGWLGGYGKCVTIHHTNGMMTRYAHLSAISVRIGQQIDSGTEIGRSGATGRVTGPHLHFEHKKIGTYVCGGRRAKASGSRKAYKRSKKSYSKKSYKKKKGTGKRTSRRSRR